MSPLATPSPVTGDAPADPKVSEPPTARLTARLTARSRSHARRALARTWGAAGRAIPPALLLALLLGAWQWYAERPGTNPLLLPAPTAVAAALVAQRDPLWANLLVTLYETAVGFGAALLTGVLLAVAMDFSGVLGRALYPLLITSQTIPIITLAPLLVLWFGFGLLSKAIVVTIICFFPVTVALADGLRAADRELIRLYQTFGAGRLRIFWSVRLPSALPRLFSGIRIAIAASVIGAIFSEYVGATAGLGFYIEIKQHVFATASVMAAIVVTAALSVALFQLPGLIERLAVPWHVAQKRHERLPT